MRKWFVPLTMLGIGSIGALVLSERGRQALEWIFDRLDEAPDLRGMVDDRVLAHHQDELVVVGDPDLVHVDHVGVLVELL